MRVFLLTIVFTMLHVAIAYAVEPIVVLTFGETFNAPSVIINGLSSLSKVICQI